MKGDKPSSHKVVGKVFSSELPAELTSLKSLLSSVVTEIGSLCDQRKLLEVKVSRLDSQLQEKQSEQEGITEAKEQLKQAVEEAQRKWQDELEEMEAERQMKLEQSWQLQEELRREKERLTEERDSLREQIEQINMTVAEQRGDLEARTAASSALLDQAQRQFASLLAQRTCAVAQLVVMREALRGAEAHSTHEQLVTIAEKSAKIDQLTNQISIMTLEREDYQGQLQSLSDKHRHTLLELQHRTEENQLRNIETEKLKMQLMTDVTLLRSKVSQLEEEKSSMEVRLLSGSGHGSAFQPVQGPQPPAQGSARFNPVQEKSQQQIAELQHKVSGEVSAYNYGLSC